VPGWIGRCGFGDYTRTYIKVSAVRDWIMQIIGSKNIPIGIIEAGAMP
jgi:hypothetical protein